jgi:3-hydroxyacyl-CoA dehydrogenase
MRTDDRLIERAGIVGAGTMGTGVAICCINAGGGMGAAGLFEVL